jgi:hypothetical protein
MGWVYADPVIRALKLAQIPGSQQVAISYELNGVQRPAEVQVGVSIDGGLTYAASTHLIGDVGNAVSPGLNRQIIWDAGLDWPGQTITSATIRLKAVDSVTNDASLDPDTLEFINRTTAAGDPVDPPARRALDDFVRETKRLGFWPQMVFVPCRQGYGAMHPLGGSPLRTNTKFVRQGTTTLTSDGVSFVPGGGWTNRVQTPFVWDQAQEPTFVGVVGHTNSGPKVNPGYSFLRCGNGTQSNLLGTYSCGEVGREVVMGYSTPTTASGEFLLCSNQCTTLRRSNFAGAQFDGTHVLRSVHNHNFRNLSHPISTTGHPTGAVSFLQATSESETHVVQGCLLIYGSVAALPMAQFWPLTAATYLKDNRNPYTYLCVGGQSNAGAVTPDHLAFGAWQQTNAPFFHYSSYSYGGQPISYWLGTDPLAPIRTSAYQSAKTIWLSGRLDLTTVDWDGVYLWVQGETDTLLGSDTEAYSPQLDNLCHFLRADLKPDLIMAVAQIDYAVQQRTDPSFGSFFIANCAGTATNLNGLYTPTQFTRLADSFTDYTWHFGDIQLTRDGGPSLNRWRFTQNGTTYYTADQDEPHPVLVSTWSAENGATQSPLVNHSRTGNIEIVRKAQRDFVAQTPRTFLLDTRGAERGIDTGNGNTDTVHLTQQNGHKTLAERFATAWTTYAGGNTIISSTINLNAETPLSRWMQDQGLSGAAALLSATPNNDGVTNLEKYAFNLTQGVSVNSILSASGNYGFPRVFVRNESGNRKLCLEIVRRKNDAQLSYQAHFWVDGQPAIRVLTPTSRANLDVTWERVTYEAPPTLWNAPKVFARVKLGYTLP